MPMMLQFGSGLSKCCLGYLVFKLLVERVTIPDCKIGFLDDGLFVRKKLLRVRSIRNHY